MDLISILFYQVCLAVQHLHQQNPPIIHRDLKVDIRNFGNGFLRLCNIPDSFQLENFLLGEDSKLKLCDFGSATTDVITPDESWSAQRRALLEDDVWISFLSNGRGRENRNSDLIFGYRSLIVLRQCIELPNKWIRGVITKSAYLRISGR